MAIAPISARDSSILLVFRQASLGRAREAEAVAPRARIRPVGAVDPAWRAEALPGRPSRDEEADPAWRAIGPLEPPPPFDRRSFAEFRPGAGSRPGREPPPGEIQPPDEPPPGEEPKPGEPERPSDRELLDRLAGLNAEKAAAERRRGAGAVARAASYSYQKGPDGRQYAVGGEVGIDSAPLPGKPEDTAAKMRIVRAAGARGGPAEEWRGLDVYA